MELVDAEFAYIISQSIPSACNLDTGRPLTPLFLRKVKALHMSDRQNALSIGQAAKVLVSLITDWIQIRQRAIIPRIGSRIHGKLVVFVALQWGRRGFLAVVEGIRINDDSTRDLHRNVSQIVAPGYKKVIEYSQVDPCLPLLFYCQP